MVAAEKKIAARIPNSERLYQLHSNINDRTKGGVGTVAKRKWAICRRTMIDSNLHLERGRPRTYPTSIAYLSGEVISKISLWIQQNDQSYQGVLHSCERGLGQSGDEQ